MSAPISAPPPVKPSSFAKWHRTVLGICLVVFAFELGLFLLIFPWLSNWEMSYIAVHSASVSDLWVSPYFRGLISGLGLLNIYVAMVEAVKQMKSAFARRR